MRSEEHVLDLLPAYALNSLDVDETMGVAQHLATCNSCRLELRTYQDITGELSLAAPSAAPSPELKRRIMQQVQGKEASRNTVARTPWWNRLASLLTRSAPVWGAVSLVLVLVLGVSSLVMWQRLNRIETAASAGFIKVTLQSTAKTPQAVGMLVISKDGNYGTLIVENLPPLDQAYQYQLWLIKDGQRTSGGVFSVNEDGYGVLYVLSKKSLISYPSFGITVEPAGGSSSPTGDKVLSGNL
jgi:anti-sigma-K factor RskA